jgi:hypothetical protein
MDGTKMKKLILVSLIIISLASLCSCEAIQKQIKEESVEKIVGKIMGEEVDVTIISPTPDPNSTAKPTSSAGGILDDVIKSNEDGEIEWPNSIPEDVPKINLDIKSRVKTPNGVILDYGEMDSNAALDYSTFLSSSLFEVIREDKSDKKIESLYRKGDTFVTIYWYEGGSFSVMITW